MEFEDNNSAFIDIFQGSLSTTNRRRPRAYRFAFFTVVAFYVLLFLNDWIPYLAFRRGGVSIPQDTQTQLTLLVAALSCFGAFLHYSREE
jgi:uncharacterized membrane protein YpjA